MRIQLASGFVEDEAVIHFREDATAAFDNHADAWKLLNSSFNLSTLSSNSERLSINSWSALLCTTSIALSMDNVTAGSYLLKFSGMDSFEGGVSFLLIDHFLNKTFSISTDQPYSFAITTDEKSKSSDRFTLQGDREPKPVVIEERHGELTVDEVNNVQWYFNDVLIEGANSSTLLPNESGTYSVIINKDGCQLKGTYEFLVTGTEHALAEGLSIYPNPTRDEFFIRSENSQPLSHAYISNALGVKVGVINLDFSNGVSTGSFSLGNQASGMYFVRCSIGQKMVIVKIIKK
jgi:Secretion system C-terminal sorting domain